MPSGFSISVFRILSGMSRRSVILYGGSANMRSNLRRQIFMKSNTLCLTGLMFSRPYFFLVSFMNLEWMGFISTEVIAGQPLEANS